jgi:hypothetical protein
VTGHVPGAQFLLGDVVPLPGHEQRQLQQIEQALCRDDPKLGRLMRAGDPRVRYARRLTQALLGAVIAAGLLVAGAASGRACLGAAGVVIVLLSLVWAVVSWRYGPPSGPRGPGRGPRRRRARRAGPGRPGRPG